MSDTQVGLLGRIAVHYKLITPDQLNEAVRAHGRVGNTRRLGEVMVDLKMITQEQLLWIVDVQQKAVAKQKAAAAAQAAPAPAPSGPGAPAGVARPTLGASRPAGAPAATPAAPAASASGAVSFASLNALLTEATRLGASDVHVHSGTALRMRIGGALREFGSGALSAQAAEKMLLDALPEKERRQLVETNDLDMAYTLPGVGRYRASFFKQQRGYDAVFRPVSANPPTLQDLGLPNSLAKLTTFHQGLVLLTGPAGCGKSSTLAALVNLINEERLEHILTVEDPIEYVFTSKKCIVNQRQAGKHTESFANALRAALREDPDIIVIGELRDMETISLAITAAETGHLVLATLHTNSAVRTINRILDVFPPKQQSQIRAMVSESLRAIVSQRLVPTADGSKRVPALEVLFVKPAISNLIRDQKTFQIRSMIQTGKAEGMCLLDDSLLELVKAGTVNKETARRFCDDPKRFA